MKIIWKYELKPYFYYNELMLQKGAKVLCVQTQNGKPTIWVLVNPDETESEARRFLLTETGVAIDEENIEYIGTGRLKDGSYVYHLFEVRE